MATPEPVATVYVCPMHGQVRQSAPGACPLCGMALVPEGTRFALFRHMASRPLHLAIMVVAMMILMAGLMMLMR